MDQDILPKPKGPYDNGVTVKEEIKPFPQLLIDPPLTKKEKEILIEDLRFEGLGDDFS